MFTRLTASVATLVLLSNVSFAQAAMGPSQKSENQHVMARLSQMEIMLETLHDRIQKVYDCNKDGQLYNYEEDACGAKPAHVEIGYIQAPLSSDVTNPNNSRPIPADTYQQRTYTVTFNNEFATVPTVLLRPGIYATWPCRGSNTDTRIKPQNVTTKGFEITTPGYASGCAYVGVVDITWIAAEGS